MMMAGRFGAVFVGLCACVVMVTQSGCLPSAFPAEMSAVAKGMAEMVRDQGVLDKFEQNLRGHVNDPGLESYTRIEVAAGVRLTGMDGDIDLATTGTGTQLPAGLREGLIAQLDGPLSDEQRAGILKILGWNRVESPLNPAPGGGG